MKRYSAKVVVLLVVGLIGVGIAVSVYLFWPRATWTDEEIATLRSLWIGSLPALAPDPSNRYSEDPAAAALGPRRPPPRAREGARQEGPAMRAADLTPRGRECAVETGKRRDGRAPGIHHESR